MMDLTVRFAPTDMLGRHTPLDARRSIRSGERSLEIATNNQELADHLRALMAGESAAILPRSWKIILQQPSELLMADPVILRKGDVVHVALGTSGWMVWDSEKNQLVGVLRATPGQAVQAIAAVIQIVSGRDS